MSEEYMKHLLEEKRKLVKSLDKDGLTFENQIKIIWVIPSKCLIGLFNKYNTKKLNITT